MLDCCGIYMVLCRPTGEYYLGSTKRSFRVRFAEHRTQMGRNLGVTPLLQAAYDTYGPDALEYVPLCVFPPDEVADREREALATLKPSLNGDHVRQRARFERWEKIDVAGKSYTIEEAAREFGLIPNTIRNRVRRGVKGLALVAAPYEAKQQRRKVYQRRK